MSAKTASKTVDDTRIIAMFMELALENDAFPKSVYKFCKESKISEEAFYQYFGSVEGLKNAIWNKFFENTVNLLDRNKEFDQFSNRDKMLTFLFTFFELLNRE